MPDVIFCHMPDLKKEPCRFVELKGRNPYTCSVVERVFSLMVLGEMRSQLSSTVML